MNAKAVTSGRTVDARLLAKLPTALPLAATALPLVGSAVAVAEVARAGLEPSSLGAFVVMYLITTLGITVGYHRLLAHRSFQAPAPVRAVLVAAGSMAFLGPAIWWAALHRRHHQTTDTPDDPHTPYRGGSTRRWHGFAFAHIGWMFAAARTFSQEPFLKTYARDAPDLLKDRTVFRGHMRYYQYVLVGQLLPAAFGYLFGGTAHAAFQAWLLGGPVRVLVVSHLIWCVNSVTHMIGSRRYASPDRSTNFWPLALLTGGEGWHNNHHAFPRSARFGHGAMQVDFGWLVIKGLAMVGLASQLHLPDALTLASRVTDDSAET